MAPRNITLVKLPPYSYDLNPIDLELVFGSVKMYVKRWPELLRGNMPFAHVNALIFRGFCLECPAFLSQVLASLKLTYELFCALFT